MTFVLMQDPPFTVRRIKSMTPTTHVKLTPREETIARLILSARSNKQIAEELAISEQSVKNRLTVLYRKLGVSNRLQLMHLLLKTAR